MIQAIETALLERLAAKITGLEVGLYPEKPEEFELVHPTGAVLVRFEAADYTKPLPTDIVTQDVTMEFLLVVVTRSLNGEGGAKEVIGDLLDVLRGYQIPGCSKIYPTKITLISENEGIWQHGVQIALVTRELEKAGTRDVIEYDEETGWKPEALQPD